MYLSFSPNPGVWREVCILVNFVPGDLIAEHLAVILLEFDDAGVGQGVLAHLLDDLEGHGGDVGACPGAAQDVAGVPDGGGDDLSVDIVIKSKDIGDVLEIRAVLEGLGVELAAKKMQAEDIEELKRINGEFASAIPTGDVAKLVELDTRFHDFIFTKADNERLQQIIGSLVEQVSRFRVTYLRKPTYHDAIAKEHEAIIRAIEGRDLEGARRCAVEHIRNQQEKLSAVEE